jgi:hypothetical protein
MIYIISIDMLLFDDIFVLPSFQYIYIYLFYFSKKIFCNFNYNLQLINSYLIRQKCARLYKKYYLIIFNIIYNQ